MAITLPNIEISFKQLANSLIKRSERGIAILVIKDDTDTTAYKEYQNLTQVQKDKSKYTATNFQYIKDIFNFALNKVAIVRINADQPIIEALNILKGNIKTGWITIADGTAEDFTALETFIKAQEQERKTYKAVVYNLAKPNSKHIINFCNENVTFDDSRGEVTGEKYCPSLIGILASCNVERGSTYFNCNNLLKVQEVADSNTAVGQGKLVLINDTDKAIVALGVNSMTTLDDNNSEDMKFIDIVEVMDLINDDISTVFKNEYLGKFKNNYDNQVILISAINTYFKSLADNNILDNNYNNKADVDVESQRKAWLDVGKGEATSWDEQTVKNNAFKRTVFLGGDIKILGAMENLNFNISLF